MNKFLYYILFCLSISAFIPVKAQESSYTITNCDVERTGYLIKQVAAESPEETDILPQQTIRVNVTEAGTYNITTNTVYGIVFSASGEFISTGVQNIVLTASGIPFEFGTYTFNLGNCSFQRTVYIPDRRFQEATEQGGVNNRHHRLLYDYFISETGKVWLKTNLGAYYNKVEYSSFNPAIQPNSATDYRGYGNLYQWGRLSDGHELINWTGMFAGSGVNETTGAVSNQGNPGHNNFITGSNDWVNPSNNELWQGEDGINNPCPRNFRLPTIEEIAEEMEAYQITSGGDAYNSPFKFVMACHRNSNNGSLHSPGQFLELWSSSTNEGASHAFYIDYVWGNGGLNYENNRGRVNGINVRCVKNCYPPELALISPQTICSENSTELMIETVAETVLWYEAEDADEPIFIGSIYITPVLSETTTYWVEAKADNPNGLECRSERLPVTVTVNPIPELETVIPNAICAGSTVTLSVITNADADSINWYETDTSEIILFTGNNIETEPLFVSTTFWVEVVSEEGCFSGKLPVSVTVNPIPELEIIQPDEICAGWTANLSVITNVDTINWYETDTLETILFTGNNIETEPLFVSTTFWVEVVSEEGCLSERIEITVIVNPLAEFVIEETNPQICTGETTVLTIITDEETINWYETETSETIIFEGNNIETPSLFETTSYWVEVESQEECISERQEIIVTVHPLPELTIENPLPEICAGETATLSVVTNLTTVNWYEFQTSETIIDTGNTITTEPLFETTSFWVEALSDEGCISEERQEIVVTVNPIPELTIETQNPEICIGNRLELSAGTDIGTIYWYDSEEAQIPIFTGPDYLTEALFVDTSFWVEAVSDDNCTSDRIEISVIVTDEILPEFEQIPAICIGETLEELPTTSLNGITGTWSPALDNTQTTEYIFTPDDAQCAVPVPMTIEVSPLPELQIENQTPEICTGENIVLSVSSTGNTIYWYDQGDAETPFHTGATYSVPGLTGTTTFWVEAVAGNCRSEREPIRVTVNPLPELLLNTPNPQVCYGSSTELNVSTQAEIIYWYDEEDAETYIAAGTTYVTPELIENGTYWVEAFHTSETGLECSSGRLAVTIEVVSIPTITAAASEPVCEGSSVTLEAYGNGEEVYWYAEEEDTEPIETGNIFETPILIENTTYWVESFNYLEDGESCASERLPVTVLVIPTPELETVQPNEICAGETITLSVVTNGQTINWYETDTSETILFEGNNFETPLLTVTTIFWVEAITGDCSTTREPVTVTVNPLPEVNSEDTIYECDNLNDGFEYVDLTDNNIIISNNPEVALAYYASLADMASESPIGNPAHFPINSSQGVVYVSAAAGDCTTIVTLHIILTGAPAVSDTSLEICSPDGTGTYQLTDANENIIANSNSYSITYHLTEQEAKDGINPLDESYENVSANQIIFARVEEGENCFNMAEIVLIYNNTFRTITPLEECDEDSDGLTTFNLTDKQQEIEAEFGGSGYMIIYYESLENAYDNVYEIPNRESYVNITNPQRVYAKVYDGAVCLGIVAYDLIAIQLPEIEIETEIMLCPGEEYTIEAPPGYESYTWTDPNGTVFSTTNSAVLDTEGTYVLEITSSDTICIFSEEIEVFFDNAPVVTNIEVNGTTVMVTATGTPPLEYSLDGGQIWQSSKVFHDVLYGEYGVKVRSVNGCESVGFKIVVFEITSVITPNNDGYNDSWEIPALVNYPGASLKLFDRNGKLLVSTNLDNGFSWDGKYNGNPLPSTSYWYILDLGNGQKMTGNVTIKNY